MKKKFLLFLTTLTFLYSLDALFIDFRFDYQVPTKSPFESPVPEEEEKEKTYSFQIGGGLLSNYWKLRDTLAEMEELEVPADAYPDRTIEKLQRVVISRQISLGVQIFLLLLSINSFIGILYNTWFSVFSGRSLFLFSMLFSLFYMGRAGFHMQHIPIPGFLAFLYNFFCFCLFIWAFRFLHNYFETYEPTYNLLYVASVQDEENNTGKIDLYYKKKRQPAFQNAFLNFLLDNAIARLIKYFLTNKIIRHFLYIIATGVFIGNVIYIPLFSLQKHYVTEFGLLIFLGIFLLTIFYIRNYYKIGKEENSGYLRNISVSIAFLQYRFLRNLTVFLLTTVGVIIFVTTLFLLLTWNASKLVDWNMIDKTINL